MTNLTVLAARSFNTRYAVTDEPVWAPLDALARIARSRFELPSFHEGEFMFMATVRNNRKQIRIHLYKHVDTRRYINLDDAGHAYAFRGVVASHSDGRSSGRYHGYRSIIDAVAHLQLWLFEMEAPLFRSFPPEAWPS